MIHPVSQSDLAEVLGVTTQTVRELRLRGLPGGRREGRRWLYDLPAAVAWYLQAKLDEAAARAGSPELQSERARKIAAEASLKEHELARQRGQYVHVRDLEPLVRRPLEMVAAKLRGAPKRHAAELSTASGLTRPEAKRILSEIVSGILTELRAIRPTVR